MSKYIRGPWKLESNKVIAPIAFGEGAAPLLVATVHMTEYDKQLKANAVLISAAPDLLEACNFFIENWKMGKFSESLQKIKSSIDKAEGVKS
jgi:hypothetical protein